MDNFYARSVFFVRDAEAALEFYTKTLGFELDWNHQYEGRAWVFEVSLFGFCLILNQVWDDTSKRAGHGRLFIGLEDDQSSALREHVRAKGITVWRDKKTRHFGCNGWPWETHTEPLLRHRKWAIQDRHALFWLCRRGFSPILGSIQNISVIAPRGFEVHCSKSFAWPLRAS